MFVCVFVCLFVVLYVCASVSYRALGILRLCFKIVCMNTIRACMSVPQAVLSFTCMWTWRREYIWAVRVLSMYMNLDMHMCKCSTSHKWTYGSLPRKGFKFSLSSLTSHFLSPISALSSLTLSLSVLSLSLSLSSPLFSSLL
jgi:hypothetical protein